MPATRRRGRCTPSRPCCRLSPRLTSFNLTIALHVWLAGMGTYLFARRTLSVGRSAALLAAVTFMFGGQLVSKEQFPNMVQAAAWLPWALWALDRLLHLRRLQDALVLGLVLGLQLLAAHAQMTVLTLYLAAAWGVMPPPPPPKLTGGESGARAGKPRPYKAVLCGSPMIGGGGAYSYSLLSLPSVWRRGNCCRRWRCSGMLPGRNCRFWSSTASFCPRTSSGTSSCRVCMGIRSTATGPRGAISGKRAAMSAGYRLGWPIWGSISAWRKGGTSAKRGFGPAFSCSVSGWRSGGRGGLYHLAYFRPAGISLFP